MSESRSTGRNRISIMRCDEIPIDIESSGLIGSLDFDTEYIPLIYWYCRRSCDLHCIRSRSCHCLPGSTRSKLSEKYMIRRVICINIECSSIKSTISESYNRTGREVRGIDDRTSLIDRT